VDGEALLIQLRTFVAAKYAADRLEEENLLDEMTGLYSMRGLARRAREIGAEAYRMRVPLACVALAPVGSLAHPPPGHIGESARDETTQLIGHLGSVLKSSGRVSDAIGRLGSEFAVVAPATDDAGVRGMLNRFRTALEAAPLGANGAGRLIEVKAGYQAVPNYAESSVDAVEMLVRASSALRDSLSP
jgi:GGDEF domain-containing protein